MYLKIKWSDKNKKTIFKDDYKKLENLLTEMSSITFWSKNEIRLTSMDSDKELIEINHDADIEYLLDNLKSSKFIEITVSKKDYIDEKSIHQENHRLSENKEAYFQNITGDISVSFPEPFGSEKSQIGRILPNKNELDKHEENRQPEDFRVLDLTLIKKDSDPNFQSAKNTELPYIDLLTEDIKEPEKEQAKKVEKEENKIISAPLQILKKHKEKLPESVTDSEILTEQSSFGISVLDRICALEKKIGDINSSRIQASQVENNPFYDFVPVQAKPVSSCNVSTRHTGVKCSECNALPIVGKRLTCLVCPSYDICENCDIKKPHIHPMVRNLIRVNEEELIALKKQFGYIIEKTPLSKSTAEAVIRPENFMFKTPAKTKEDDLKTPIKPKDTITPPLFTPSNKEEMRDLLSFMDPDKRVNHNDLIQQFGHLPLEEFIMKAQNLISFH